MEQIKNMFNWVKSNIVMILGAFIGILYLFFKNEQSKVQELKADKSLNDMKTDDAVTKEKLSGQESNIKKEEASQEQAKQDLDKANKEVTPGADYYNKRYNN